MKASTAIPTVDSGHFEKRKRDRRAGNSKAGNVPNSQLSRRQDNAIDGSMDWQDIAVDWRRCESMYIAWSGGHGPFNINATSYPDNANGDASTGLEWQIANLVGNHNYFWTGEF